MRLNALLIGSLTLDENYLSNVCIRAAGGGVYFAAKTFENLNVSVTVVSPCGYDFPKKYLPKTVFLPDKPAFEKTLLFKNIYLNGKRKQSVENYEGYLNYQWFTNLPVSSDDVDIVMIAPVVNNFTAEDIQRIKKKFPKSFFCLFPQGLYRQIGDTGKVTRIDRDFSFEIIRTFDFISFSDQDFDGANEKASRWSKAVPLVAVTRNGDGASLYSHGERTDSPAFNVNQIVDPTGAGDIFAAGFVYAYLVTKQITSALDFAQAAAALSLLETSNHLQYKQKDIMEFAAAQGRPIKI